MTTPQVAASTPVATVAPRHAGKRRTRGGPGGQAAPAASRDAVKAVAVILQVLGGALTPEQAAGVLEISLPRYYALELKALEGMAVACEPKGPGRRPRPEREVEKLRRENQRLERDCARHQALARSAHRALGLAMKATMPKSASDAGGKKKPRKRRPSARALKVARSLQQRLAAPGMEPPAARSTATAGE